KIIAKDWENAFWEIPNTKSNHKERTEHPAQFPIALAERCVLACSNENDWVFDPYAGVGTSLVAAIKQGRKAVGAEKEDCYVNIAKERIQSFYSGHLPYRPLGKPIYRPSGKTKISRIPEQWKDEEGVY
ncbi:MAG: site-specific DNA-methyltransferase, partial [Chloroflexota bacterium]|nr:site-specific DNA-methyltransferase [Chloroflexota bacterium]